MRDRPAFGQQLRATLMVLGTAAVVGVGCSDGTTTAPDPTTTASGPAVEGKCDPMPRPISIKGTSAATADDGSELGGADEGEVICDGVDEGRPEPRDPTPTYDPGESPIDIPTPH